MWTALCVYPASYFEVFVLCIITHHPGGTVYLYCIAVGLLHFTAFEAVLAMYGKRTSMQNVPFILTKVFPHNLMQSALCSVCYAGTCDHLRLHCVISHMYYIYCEKCFVWKS